VVVLAWRELLHFFRQPLRLLGSLAQPLMLWLLMGSGFANSFRPGSDALDYSEFFYPGIVVMLLLFAAIFSTITLIEDRSAGFLQAVLVAPVSRLSLVLGKLVGGTAIALIQAFIFLLLAPLAGFDLCVDMVIHLVLLFALVGLGFAGFGFIVAWTMDTVAGYHAVMSVVMIPMWLLSGALFPVESSAAWLQLVMLFNPITYTMQTIRSAFYEPLSALYTNPDYLFALAVTALWTSLSIAGAVQMAARQVHD
jgi:ABC-2 type transport system permease protein